MVRKFFVFIFFILSAHFSFAQTKEQIKAQQQALQKEIQELNSNLSEVKKSHNVSLAQLKMIEDKINARHELISNISKDIKSLDQQIVVFSSELDKHQKELETLKSNYAKSLVDAYKKRNSFDYVNFLFSAKSFNDAYKRMQYLKSYRTYRDAQVNDIKTTQSLVQKKLNDIASLKGNKNTALNSQNAQLQGLENDKVEKDETIKKLIEQEGALGEEIAKREKQREKLRSVMLSVIRAEIAEAQKQEQDRLAKIAAARIAEQERQARAAAEREAIANAERARQAQLEKERREREEAERAAAEAERQRRLAEERIARENAEREERMQREKKAMEERLAREKADAEWQKEKDRQLKRMEERNRQIDEANARDLAKKRAEEDKAKKELERIEKARAANNRTNTATAAAPAETQEQIKRRVEAEVRTENRQAAADLGRNYNVLESSRENMTMSLDFEKNKGSLPWPASGYISQPFGNYSLPGSKIREYNPGIEITSNGDAGVRAVANGVVSVVVNMDDGYTVIVRHGKYFTAYNHLSNVAVSKGQSVQSGTHLGVMSRGEFGKPTMLFIVSDDKGNELNPANWLR